MKVTLYSANDSGRRPWFYNSLITVILVSGDCLCLVDAYFHPGAGGGVCNNRVIKYDDIYLN